MATGRGPGTAGAPRPDLGGQMLLLLALLLAMFVLFDNDIRQALGNGVGMVLGPAFGFDGRMPVITLLLTGLLTSCFTITVRQLFTDWVGQARAARIAQAFNKELREARQSNNTYKLKKLTELQPQIMSAQMKASQTQLKLMPVTMIIVVPTFAWLANFVYMDLQSTAFSVPWEFNASMKSSNVLPNWILLYSLLTLPFGQLLTRVLKYFSFSRKLERLESGGSDLPDGLRQE